MKGRFSFDGSFDVRTRKYSDSYKGGIEWTKQFKSIWINFCII